MVASTTRAYAGPLKYIQGPGEFGNLEQYTAMIGERPLYLIDGFLYGELSGRLGKIYTTDFHTVCFNGECCQEEVDRLRTAAMEYGAGVIVGVGGGKAQDTAKIVAGEDYPLVIVPTSASTDAPCTALSVLYTAEGVYVGQVRHKRNPALIVMDTEIVAKAPLRLFIAGMADALATYYEALANERSDSPNYITRGYRRTKAAMAIAKMSYDILLAEGVQAVEALKAGAITDAVENVIEANTLLSGVGFENTGCACAHGIHSGLTELPATHKYYHGEKVAFGIVCQLVLENAPLEELNRALGFLHGLGLPVTLGQLDVEATPANARIIAKKTVHGGKLIHAEPMLVTEDIVVSTILAADKLGQRFIDRGILG